jgi:membrane associated rhomboid family serine protease
MTNLEDGDAPVEVGRFTDRKKAGEYALVLVAAGMDCQLARRDGEIMLLVAASNAELARHELAGYAVDSRPEPAPAPRAPASDAITGILAFWCVLVFVFAASGRDLFGIDWYAVGEGQTGLTLAGEWWRVFTALGLHANLGHIASNLAAGSLFGFFLAEILGSGLAWLMIVLAGGGGNALNDLFAPASHTSIGASTAVFGAVGLLAVLASRHWPVRRRGLRRWAPLAAGIMLLAFLGTEGEQVDVGAHLGGFVAGVLLGILLLAINWTAPTRTRNVVGSVGAIALFAGAWLVALFHAGG